MPKKLRKKTLADYVVIAVSPALIMTLVGSLAFFLLELGYHGQFEMRLRWILFWFVLAAVLVARIAIEQGREYASLFGIALTVAVGLVTLRLVDEFVVAWLLLGICWWCAWKLTWDCTLIDDRQDASGEGLLRVARVDPAQPESKSPQAPLDTETRDRAAHAPGKWLVYFSLAALPLFGAGQLLIPSHDAAARTYAFGFLVLYVASALGLLLTTSFLGLRRYLRQRNLRMPAAMTGAWLGMGSGLAIAILCLALFVPQPQGEYSLTALVDKVDARLRDASRFAVVPGDRAKGEGRRIGERDPAEGKAGNRPPQNKDRRQNEDRPQQQGPGERGPAGKPRGEQGKPAGTGGNQPGQNQNQDRSDQKGQAKDTAASPAEKSDKQSKDQQTDEQQANARQANPKQAEQQRPGGQNPDGHRANAQQPNNPKAGDPPRSSPTSPEPSASVITRLLQWLAGAFKWAVYAVLALIAIRLAVRHWSRISEFLSRLWAELLGLFRRGQKPQRTAEPSLTVVAPPRPFADYDNPFGNGRAGRMSPAQLVSYTFEALEAWGREQVVARPADQTPLEFAYELRRRVPALAKEVTTTAELYGRVVYAHKNPSRDAVEVLERLWRGMEMGAGVGATAAAAE